MLKSTALQQGIYLFVFSPFSPPLCVESEKNISFCFCKNNNSLKVKNLFPESY